MPIQPDKIATIIREVAEDKIVPRFQQLKEGDVRTKSGPGDLVTIADEEAEIELSRILPDILPGSFVIGEEAVSSGKILREMLQESDEYIWIVDPVDGTHNFAHGIPKFGTMVALVKGGEKIGAWIYQIPTQKMVSAQRGQGVQINGEAIAKPAVPAPDADFKTMRAFISRKYMPPAIRPYVEEKIKLLDDAKTHFCCAWEYVSLVEGRRAFSIYKRIEPWDHLAGVLLLEEQGCFVRKWDKTPYTARDLNGGLINAPSEELWDRIYKEFLAEPLSGNVA